jgi:hypothetical protein
MILMIGQRECFCSQFAETCIEMYVSEDIESMSLMELTKKTNLEKALHRPVYQ